MQSRVETRNDRTVRVTTQRSIVTGDVAEFVEPVGDDENTPESVQNREKSVHNIPASPGGNDMQRFNDDPIQNDSCEGVPNLDPPTYQNQGQDGQQDTQPATEFQNVEGDMVPVLEPPAYNVARKIHQREQSVQNGSDGGEDSDVPTLEPPTYQPRGKE